MSAWICRTCAVEHPDSDEPPTLCRICSDERQYVPPQGQRWTTLAELVGAPHCSTVTCVEDGLYGLAVTPRVGIGQRALVIQRPGGNLLWDPPGYLDEHLATAVEVLGGIAAIATSHPHMFGVQTAWSHRFGSVPVYVSAPDREWVQRDDPVILTWTDTVEVVPGVTLHRVGGHFPGSAVARFTGSDGQGVLLSGDAIFGTPNEQWVTFMRSYSNGIPLSAATVEAIVARVHPLDFDRLYDNVGGQVRTKAAAWVRRSADRYIAWVSGGFDYMT